jgi:hypothetical protein
MGIPFSTPSSTPPAGDQATNVLTGTFAATGAGAAIIMYGTFNVLFGGRGGGNTAWSGTVRLERSLDGGVTWWVAGVGGAGAQSVWNTGTDVSVQAFETERGVAYRLNCTAYTSGTIDWRISGTGILATTHGIVGA